MSHIWPGFSPAFFSSKVLASGNSILYPTKESSEVLSKMNDNKIMESLLAPKDGKHLGDLCGWSLHGQFDRDIVTKVADELGLADDFQFPNITPISAYRRAAVDSCKDAARNDERGWSAELVQNDESYIVHELVSKQIKQGGISALTDMTAAFSAETSIRFDKTGYHRGQTIETLMELEHAAHPMAQRAAALYLQYLTTLKASDIRAGFQRAFAKWQGMRILDHGGLWLVPSPYAEKVRAWKDWLAKIGCTALIIPVFDTEETVESMQEMARASLEGQLTSIIGELEAFSHKDNTRISTLESRLEAFDNLRSKTEMYERLLGMKMEQLKTRLGSAASSLKTSLSAIV